MLLREVADAVAWSGRRSPVEPAQPAKLAEVLSKLEAVKSELVRQFCEACNYATADAEALWADQMAYLELLAAGGATLARVDWTRRRRDGERHGRLEFAPYESTVVSLPSNAPVPLAAIFAACAGIAGTRVLFAAPRPVAGVVGEVLSYFENFGEIALAHERTSHLLPALLEARVVDHVYFLGSSHAYRDIASQCAGAGAALTFEGQGNSIAVVSASVPSIDAVADHILRSKQFCSGRMCTSPSVILADAKVFQDLCDSLGKRAASYPLPRTLADEVMDPEWRHAMTSAKEFIPVTRKLRESCLSPGFIVVRNAADLPMTDSFSPLAAIQPVADFEEALASVGLTPFRLQVSYYGRDSTEVRELRRIRFARYCINIDPTDQDPFAPWGNFGASGDSRVVSFIEKFQTPVLIEEAAL